MGPNTIICDIDGTLVEHQGDICQQHLLKLKILDGTLDKLKDWDRKGYRIILLTGRREGVRKFTEKQLAEAGIFYDLLIMGVGNGKRFLINDKKPFIDDETAIGISINRNEGIKNVNI
jgi:hydroxymethylpyrimidine pyrophosphatase-like HAD family hydrolase